MLDYWLYTTVWYAETCIIHVLQSACIASPVDLKFHTFVEYSLAPFDINVK